MYTVRIRKLENINIKQIKLNDSIIRDGNIL